MFDITCMHEHNTIIWNIDATPCFLGAELIKSTTPCYLYVLSLVSIIDIRQLQVILPWFGKRKLLSHVQTHDRTWLAHIPRILTTKQLHVDKDIITILETAEPICIRRKWHFVISCPSISCTGVVLLGKPHVKIHVGLLISPSAAYMRQ